MLVQREIVIKEITEVGNILTSYGELGLNHKYDDVENILGELKFEGDYQYFNFYKISNYIRISTKTMKGKVHFKKGLLSALLIMFEDDEISRMTAHVKTGQHKIKIVRTETENLIQLITQKSGKSVRGRKYFKKYDNGTIDLGKPTSQWPHILISFI